MSAMTLPGCTARFFNNSDVFSYATVFDKGIALVRSSGDEGRWGFINEQGKYIIPATYDQATFFSEDLAWVVSKNRDNTALIRTSDLSISTEC